MAALTGRGIARADGLRARNDGHVILSQTGSNGRSRKATESSCLLTPRATEQR